MPNPTPEAFADFLYRYCDVNAPTMIAYLRERISKGDVPRERAAEISENLQKAAKGEFLTPQEYKKLTGDNECTTNALLRERMQDIWNDLFS